jgi:hypothetical protein
MSRVNEKETTQLFDATENLLSHYFKAIIGQGAPNGNA